MNTIDTVRVELYEDTLRLRYLSRWFRIIIATSRSIASAEDHDIEFTSLTEMPESVRTAVVVGCGVIGMGWGVLFLSKGLKVIISDPVEGAEDNFKRYIQNAEFLFETRGDFERLSTNYEFVSDVIPRLAEADFVQEVCLPSECSSLLKVLLSRSIH
jgi:hypothetical protein